MASPAHAARPPLWRLPPAVGPGLLTAASVAVLATACGGNPPPTDPAATTPPATAPVAASQQLAARAAAAKDRHYTARYRLTGRSQPARTVEVTVASDGTWRVDVPGGALGGAKAVAIVAVRTGVYQCVLGAAGGCVKVAAPRGAVPAAYDPRIQHLFTRWLDVFVDRGAALSVTIAKPPNGTGGTCYSVEPTAASLTSPVDPGLYCFAADGTVTGARFGGISMVLVGTPGPPPPSVTLPEPVVRRPAAGTAAPPPPPAASPRPPSPTARDSSPIG